MAEEGEEGGALSVAGECGGVAAGAAARTARARRKKGGCRKSAAVAAVEDDALFFVRDMVGRVVDRRFAVQGGLRKRGVSAGGGRFVNIGVSQVGNGCRGVVAENRYSSSENATVAVFRQRRDSYPLILVLRGLLHRCSPG